MSCTLFSERSRKVRKGHAGAFHTLFTLNNRNPLLLVTALSVNQQRRNVVNFSCITHKTRSDLHHHVVSITAPHTHAAERDEHLQSEFVHILSRSTLLGGQRFCSGVQVMSPGWKKMTKTSSTSDVLIFKPALGEIGQILARLGL